LFGKVVQRVHSEVGVGAIFGDIGAVATVHARCPCCRMCCTEGGEAHGEKCQVKHVADQVASNCLIFVVMTFEPVRELPLWSWEYLEVEPIYGLPVAKVATRNE
jgi:hypothetical protein